MSPKNEKRTQEDKPPADAADLDGIIEWTTLRFARSPAAGGGAAAAGGSSDRAARLPASGSGVSDTEDFFGGEAVLMIELPRRHSTPL